jgi:hypothetical protein
VDEVFDQYEQNQGNQEEHTGLLERYGRPALGDIPPRDRDDHHIHRIDDVQRRADEAEA